jgi:hypothetical protein
MDAYDSELEAEGLLDCDSVLWERVLSCDKRIVASLNVCFVLSAERRLVR